VKRFRRSANHELERELRKHRPEPRSALVSALAAEIHGDTRRRTLMPRLALAGALAVAMVTFFAVFGGAGYTTSAVQSIDVSRLAQAVGKGNSSSNSVNNSSSANSNNANNANNTNSTNGNNGNNGDDDDADDDEYKPGKGCGDKNHVHERENECKKLK
jgi:hypothetical protein